MSANGNRKDRRRPIIFRIAYRIVLIVAAVALILSYISIYINPSKSNIPLFFGLFYIPILAINVFMLIISLIARSKSVWITIIALLPSLLYLDLFVKVFNNDTPSDEGIKLNIVSYNVGTFNASKEKLTRGECMKQIINHFNDISPDIICIQELFVNSYTTADTIFSNYPYRHYHLYKINDIHLFGNITLSKFPIVNTGDICFEKSTNVSIYTDISHYDKIIRVFNNHLESYNVSFTSIVKKLSAKVYKKRYKDVIDGDLGDDIIDAHDRMLNSFIKRSDQVNTILQNIEKSKLPAIICGDFNDTPVSYAYHMLCKGRKDSFKMSGKGFGGTFVHLWPLLRIDYILYPDNYSSTRHITERLGYSDHYPIRAELII